MFSVTVDFLGVLPGPCPGLKFLGFCQPGSPSSLPIDENRAFGDMVVPEFRPFAARINPGLASVVQIGRRRLGIGGKPASPNFSRRIFFARWLGETIRTE